MCLNKNKSILIVIVFTFILLFSNRIEAARVSYCSPAHKFQESYVNSTSYTYLQGLDTRVDVAGGSRFYTSVNVRQSSTRYAAAWKYSRSGYYFAGPFVKQGVYSSITYYASIYADNHMHCQINEN